MKRRLLHQRGAAADPGHRYQMWCKNGIGEDICIGYSDCATSFQQMIERHPVWHSWRAEELPQIAQNLGMALPIVEATTVEELDIAFASAAAQHADAISVFGDAVTVNNAPRVTALAAKHRLPASYLFRLFATNGGLISYGPALADLFIRAGGYVDKILKGTKPSDLPVELPTKFEMVINVKSAKALGLTVPPRLLAQANEVIE